MTDPHAKVSDCFIVKEKQQFAAGNEFSEYESSFRGFFKNKANIMESSQESNSALSSQKMKGNKWNNQPSDSKPNKESKFKKPPQSRGVKKSTLNHKFSKTQKLSDKMSSNEKQ